MTTQLEIAGGVSVKVSAASARLLFHGCDYEYIKNVCHGRCCDSATYGTLIAIHASEQSKIEARGGCVKGGILQLRPGEKRCCFKSPEGFCGLHFTPDKPFGCIASPFALNRCDTLIIRNRYKLLRCHKDNAKIPAYVAFRASLVLLFGEAETSRLCKHLDDGGGDLSMVMDRAIYAKLKDEEHARSERVKSLTDN